MILELFNFGFIFARQYKNNAVGQINMIKANTNKMESNNIFRLLS